MWRLACTCIFLRSPEETRACCTPFTSSPLREDGTEVGEGKSQELRRLPGCLVAHGDNIWERNVWLVRLFRADLIQKQREVECAQRD